MLSKNDHKRLYWLSGSTCAGKTEISSALAKRFDWNVYHCDEWEEKQREHADPDRHPNWYSYSHLTGDKLWLMPVERHITFAESAYDDQFELILEDLAKLLRADGRPLLYDGYGSPRNIAPLIPSKKHVFYLISTEPFQRQYYEQRPWIHEVLGKTSNTEEAWKNWMMRDSLSAKILQKEIQEHQMPWLLVDGSITLGETIERVACHFQAGGNAYQ
jgi:hypothetical protein